MSRCALHAYSYIIQKETVPRWLWFYAVLPYAQLTLRGCADARRAAARDLRLARNVENAVTNYAR